MTASFKIGLAGCGKMGASMVRGWLSAGLLRHIDILDPNGVPPDLVDPKIAPHTDERSFTQNAAMWDMLVIAIKPQIMENFCASISPLLPAGTCVLSIAAGKTITSLEHSLGGRPVIRSMPNTPAAIQKGMTVACANNAVTQDNKKVADALLRAMGKVEWATDESLLDAVTAVSGSGPAYVFYLIETLAKAGEKAGLDKPLSMALARQTVIGSAALADHEADLPAYVLRENVTSPNGTTAAALSVLMDGRFQNLMDEAVATATARSKALSTSS